MISAAWRVPLSSLFYSLLRTAPLQSCVYKSDLRSTNTLSRVSTIPRIKRIQVKLFHSNYISCVYITFLGAAALPVVMTVKSLILCRRDCASYPSPGPHSSVVQLPNWYFPVESTWGFFNEQFFFYEKGVELSSDMSGHPKNMSRLDVFSSVSTSLHPACQRWRYELHLQILSLLSVCITMNILGINISSVYQQSRTPSRID